MAQRAYSERFFNLNTLLERAVWEYRVPAGHRAIVTNVLGLNGGSGANAYLGFAGIISWGWNTSVTLALISTNMRVVVYAGEYIQLYIETLSTRMTVCGYLIEDPVATALGPAEEEQRVQEWPVSV